MSMCLATMPRPRLPDQDIHRYFSMSSYDGSMPKVLTLLEPTPSAACCAPLTEAALTAEQAEDWPYG